jgi:hypothetical protein
MTSASDLTAVPRTQPSTQEISIMTNVTSTLETGTAERPTPKTDLEGSVVEWNNARTGEPHNRQEVVSCSAEVWSKVKDNAIFAGWACFEFTLGVVLVSPVGKAL